MTLKDAYMKFNPELDVNDDDFIFKRKKIVKYLALYSSYLSR